MSALSAPRATPRQVEKTPGCGAACVTGGDVRGWIGTIAQRRKLGLTDRQAYQRAWATLVAANPFPATLGRICSHPCEGACARAGLDGAVAINALERFLGDWALRERLPLPILEERSYPESIGVVGAGPAGLSFAYQMARRGYAVTVYEGRDKPGGMLRSHIPSFRLPESVIDAEIRRLLELGVDLKVRTAIGCDVTADQLRDRHSILFLGIGAGRGVRLGIPGERGEGVWLGVDFLAAAKRGELAKPGSRVIVVGGGNTAVDAARVARRLGAEVTVLYRRAAAQMPAIAGEIEAALSEGVVLRCHCSPVRIARDSGGNVVGVVARGTHAGPPDGEGLPDDGNEQVESLIAADSVIVAISQVTDWAEIGDLEPPGVGDARHSTQSCPVRIHMGGDMVRPGIAGSAISHGRQAAEAIHAELRGLPDATGAALSSAPRVVAKAEYYAARERAEVPSLSVNERFVHPDAEVEQTLSEQAFLTEATRCFSCGRCFGCEHCYMYCPAGAFTRMQTPATGAYFALDLDRCEGCGKCVDLCPSGFLSAASAKGSFSSLRTG